MSTQIDFRTLPANVPSLCIPRVYANISESRIRKIFDELNMGTIERIDLVSKNNDKGEKFNRVFIHFRHWNNSENACIARERLLNGKEIKIIYDDPWFWKISAYREKVEVVGPRDHSKKQPNRPRLEFEASTEPRRPPRYPHAPKPRHTQSNIAPRIAPCLPVERKPVVEEKTDIKQEDTEDRINETIIREENNAEKPFEIDYGDVALPPPRKMKRVPQSTKV